ncbi:UspA [Corchorus capsularis]|uniref:UspA n=1 Tax=Corchorus capsularis TaxID=210143 RepID=A0A1R3G222_COCAP|nr:UspA [Corchorus capsularis]
MDVRKIIVIVEDEEVARTALRWALHNLLRYGDLLTLLHVFSPNKSRSKKKARLLRLQGYQLALSFKEICNSNFFNTNIEIIVTEGDQQGRKILAMVREIGASVLVVGVHDQSFLYKLAMAHENISNSLNCRVLAIKQPELPPLKSKSREILPPLDSSTNMDFSQIEISGLQVPDIPPPKIPYRICPSPSAIIWRSRKLRKKKSYST